MEQPNRRKEGNDVVTDARGLAARALSKGVHLADLELRESDDPVVLLELARAEAARLVMSACSENLMASLKILFERDESSLEAITWEQLERLLQSYPPLLSKIDDYRRKNRRLELFVAEVEGKIMFHLSSPDQPGAYAERVVHYFDKSELA